MSNPTEKPEHANQFTHTCAQFGVPRYEFIGPGSIPQGAMDEISMAFTECLNRIEAVVPRGRPMSLVLTKMQEACMWAKRGAAEALHRPAPASAPPPSSVEPK